MAHALLSDQPSLDGFCPVAEAVHQLAHHAGAAQRGAVYTRIEVVDFMLDLAGYTPDQPLHRLRLLEPSFGGGEFLLAAVRRLLIAARSAGAYAAVDLAHCIRAVELHHDTFASTRLRLLTLLTESGLPPAECARLCSAWLQSGDFLLQALPGRFDVIVGNPPYVRQELLAPALLAQYRKLYRTLYDRADLYVPFIERSLNLLAPGGQLVFICADRWLKNKYGGPLRAMVMAGFHLRAYVNMVDTPAFDSTVQAYPAITLIENAPRAATLVAEQPALNPATLAPLAAALRADAACPALGVSRVEHIGSGSEPWVLSDSAQRALLRRLEANFPTLEDAGCKVGIGVATGADAAYIAPMHELDVEPSRKLALVTTKDIASGELRWHGLGVINPFEDDGQLADLSHYPRLRAHLERHRPQIAARHVARKNPANWYRTIDRITPGLRTRPKLLIPDIKGSAHVVYDEGRFYPHHNLYFVLSDTWDLRALQAVLLSGIARHCVAAYSTTLRGGFLRFQAQYLRRIRLPYWHDVPPALRQRLIQAATTQNRHACHQAACELYGLSPAEAALLAQD